MKSNHKSRTLWLAGILHAFTHIYQIALMPLYLLIQRDLKLASVEQATLLVTIMGVAYYLPSYPMGVLADRLSRKKLLAVGLAINGIGFACLGLSTNYALALVSVAIAGFGGSFFHPAATALIARMFPEGRGKALGLVGIGASVGLFIGPIYSGWRAQTSGNWRLPVIELGLAGLVFAGIFYWLGEEEVAEATVPHAERRRQKMFPTNMLGFIFILTALAFSLRDFAGTSMGSLGSLFLQNARGFSPGMTGLMLAGMFLASSVSNPIFGHLSDGGRIRWAVLLISIAVVLVASFPYVTGGWMYLVLGAYGFFFMAHYPIVEAALMESVPDAVRGRVFGLFITFGGLLGNLSHWVVGAMVKNLGPNASNPVSYHSIYGLMAMILLTSMLGLPCLYAIRKREGMPHVSRKADASASAVVPNSAIE